MAKYGKGLAAILFFSHLVGSPSARADFGATVGGSFLLGSLSNSQVGLNSRIMSVSRLESLIGYKTKTWILGIDFDYRWQDQLTSLENAGGTNLRGSGWLLGIGTRYQIDEKWSIQSSIGFLGRYRFAKQTYASEDAGLGGPLSVGLKAQYFFLEGKPLSADLNLNWIRYGDLRILSTDYTATSNSFLVGVGLSWHFGHFENEAREKPVTSMLPMLPNLEEERNEP